MAAVSISDSNALKIWHAHGLKLHRVQEFKISNGKRFGEKLDTIVGLCFNSPENVIVLWVNEKSQIQALERTKPGPSLKKAALRP